MKTICKFEEDKILVIVIICVIGSTQSHYEIEGNEIIKPFIDI